MAEYEQQKRIPHRRIECPHCGNEITAKGTNEEQKCRYCRRKYKINYTRRGKKFHWEPVAIDYSYEAEGRTWVGTKLEEEVNGNHKQRRYYSTSHQTS